MARDDGLLEIDQVHYNNNITAKRQEQKNKTGVQHGRGEKNGRQDVQNLKLGNFYGGKNKGIFFWKPLKYVGDAMRPSLSLSLWDDLHRRKWSWRGKVSSFLFLLWGLFFFVLWGGDWEKGNLAAWPGRFHAIRKFGLQVGSEIVQKLLRCPADFLYANKRSQYIGVFKLDSPLESNLLSMQHGIYPSVFCFYVSYMAATVNTFNVFLHAVGPRSPPFFFCTRSDRFALSIQI